MQVNIIFKKVLKRVYRALDVLQIQKYISQRQFLQSKERNSCVIDLPLEIEGIPLPRKLYKYWWVAENIQYYHLDLIRYKKNYYFLGIQTCFAYFPLDYSFEEYFNKVIKSAERALIRKSIKNGFYCKEILYDDYVDEIAIINTSKKERGGRPMTIDYTCVRKRDAIVKAYNPNIYTYGIFSIDGKLVAYYMFELVTNFFHTVKGIGHKDYLKYGIMNHLFAYSISELKKLNLVGFIIYGCISRDPQNGLSRYKYNVGCQEKNIILKGTKRQIKNIELFNRKYILHGDTSMNFVLDYMNI